MSDILEKLLGVEKDAAVLVAEAEAEAGRRKAAARVEAEERCAEALRRKAAELEKRIAAERERIAAERDEKNRSYRESIAAHPLDRAAFARVVMDFIEKGV